MKSPLSKRTIRIRTLFDHPQGCVLIFLSGFLAMMIKMDVAGKGNQSVFGVFLVALNVALLLAVSWFVVRHITYASDDEDTASV